MDVKEELLVPEAELKKKLGADVFHCEELKGHKTVGRGKYYLVKWKGYTDVHNTWEPEKNILDKNLIRLYEEKQKQAGPSAVTPMKEPATVSPVASPVASSASGKRAPITGRRGARQPSQSARKRQKLEEPVDFDDVDMEGKAGEAAVPPVSDLSKSNDDDTTAVSSTPPVASGDNSVTSSEAAAAGGDDDDDKMTSSSAVGETTAEVKLNGEKSATDSPDVTKTAESIDLTHNVPPMANGLADTTTVQHEQKESSPPIGSQPVPVEVPVIGEKPVESGVSSLHNGDAAVGDSHVRVIVTAPTDSGPMEESGDGVMRPLADKKGDSSVDPAATTMSDVEGKKESDFTKEVDGSGHRGFSPEYKQL